MNLLMYTCKICKNPLFPLPSFIIIFYNNMESCRRFPWVRKRILEVATSSRSAMLPAERYLGERQRCWSLYGKWYNPPGGLISRQSGSKDRAATERRRDRYSFYSYIRSKSFVTFHNTSSFNMLRSGAHGGLGMRSSCETGTCLGMPVPNPSPS